MCLESGLGMCEFPPITVWPAWHVGCGISCTEFCHPMGSSHQRLPRWKGDEHNPAINEQRLILRHDF